MSAVKVGSQTIAVEHVTVVSERSFADVRRKLEETLPSLDPKIADELSSGDAAAARAYDDRGPKLSIFLTRDHGALLQIAGGRKNALQYEIGNPLTASKMTRHKIAAALYAPLRVSLYEADDGTARFEYDKPSTLFGQFGDEKVTEVARDLDSELEAALRNAAG